MGYLLTLCETHNENEIYPYMFLYECVYIYMTIKIEQMLGGERMKGGKREREKSCLYKWVSDISNSIDHLLDVADEILLS